MLFLIYTLFAFFSQALAIWPAPVSLSTGSSVLWISPDVKVTYNGRSVWWTPFIYNFSSSQTEQFFCAKSSSVGYGNDNVFTSQRIVQEGIARTLQIIFKSGLVPWKLVARHELSKIEPSASSSKAAIKVLTIIQTGKDTPTSYKPLDGDLDESYNLTITTDGAARIEAVSAVGVLHALETFTQLFFLHSSGNGVYTNLAPVAISDAPKFAHRGLNMDVSRNWYPVADIKRTIDGLAMNKFNRMHIHMTDSQSWPIEIPALPELAAKGAYQAGLTYSPNDIKDIQTYGILRGIEIYMEFDMPGHTTSIALAYPDLIAAANAHPWDTYCSEPPCGSLKLNEPAVGKFLDTLWDDLLPRISPYTSYFHTGGDEVNANAYLLDPTVKSKDPLVIGPLIQILVDRNHAALRKNGLTPIVWEEMLLQWNLTLGSDVVVQAWQSDENVALITGKGHKALAGNYNYWVSGTGL
jgi:hexosaminidase